MLILASTSDKIQLVTSVAGDIDVHASWVDKDGETTFTPGRTNTIITTAATTDIVAAPTGTIKRNVQTLSVRNVHATLSNTVTVIHTDGTNAVELESTTLAPGQRLTYDDAHGFTVRALLLTKLTV